MSCVRQLRLKFSSKITHFADVCICLCAPPPFACIRFWLTLLPPWFGLPIWMLPGSV